MVNLLVAAALAAATSTYAQPPAAPAQPALFVVRNGATTVYIFGTFHALDGRTEWFGDKVRNAFDQSNELVLETLLPEGPSEASGPNHLVRAPSFTPSASFLATTRMAINAGRTQGMQVGNGADMILRHAAEFEGKQVQGLETLQLQINMFNRMPPTLAPQHKGFTKASADQIDGLSKAMAEMQDAWKKGDQSVFVRMLTQLKAASPEAYRMMFTERNERWADWVRARMQTPGTVFVAVGAGHLAGPDSLLVDLAERGIPSERVY